MLFDQFENAREECKRALEADLPLPAYDYCLVASHTFNVLDARKAISVTQRQNYILKIRELARGCALKYKEVVDAAKQIYDFLDELSPFSLQESWDNSGLIVGDFEDEIQRIYLSLDIDSSLIDEVVENSLIITHHPLIFKGLKKITASKYPSNIIKKMIKKDISLIAMHTNFDKTHLNHYVATKVFGFENVQCDEFICSFDCDMSFEDLTLHVKKTLGINSLRVVGDKKYIKRCALTTGSGGELIPYVKADCYLSGDLKYHQALEAKENGLNLIDIGHFESESYFTACMSENLKNFPLKVIMSNSKNPFDYK